MLYNIIIGPIETLVDWVFHFIINRIPQIGVIGAVVGVSLTINYLALPLYNVADSLQEKERNIQKKLDGWVKHIKKTFKGDERFMMLSTYYRENNYHPLYALRSSLSILIEIPFFIAAYHYLSHCEALRNVSFWIFKDLGAPDGLLSFHAFGHLVPVHVLPILMTLINFVSGAIYTRDCVFREKIQQYAIASIFLVLLYKSPSGLVIYWILNNLFSLAKNIVNKTKNPARILHASICIICAIGTVWYLVCATSIFRKCFVFLFFLLVLLFPRVLAFVRKIPVKFANEDSRHSQTMGIILAALSGLSLSVLVGYLLPTHIFINEHKFFVFNPKLYVFETLTVALGFFVFWPICIYKMFGEKVKKCLPSVLFALFAVGATDVLLFCTDFSLLTLTFDYEKGSHENESVAGFFIPLLIFVASVGIPIFIRTFRKRIVLCSLIFICFSSEIFLSARSVFDLRKVDYSAETEQVTAYLNCFPPKEILAIRRRSHRQVKNFVFTELLPPSVRETFFFNFSEKTSVEVEK